MSEIKFTNTPADELRNAEGQTIAEAVSFRKMATIRRVDNIEPIEGADKIVCATVGGWKLVTAITNGFKIGDLVVYCEIDSWIPTKVAPFLTKPGHFPKTFNEVQGEKLRTIKLRGQVSQGLIMPIASCIEICGCWSPLEEGTDVSEWLGIQKYEKPMDAKLAGMAKGNFPSRIFKTDQERIQNLKRELETYANMNWEITEKMEGSSMTAYVLDDVFGVCSRNLDLKETEGNTFWDTARAFDLETKLRKIGGNIAIQGELIGPGIQDNIYGLTKHEFRLFDIFYPDTMEYAAPVIRQNICDNFQILHVPILFEQCISDDMQTLIQSADGKSQIGTKPNREGIVFKSQDGKTSFKAISNLYLEKQKD